MDSEPFGGREGVGGAGMERRCPIRINGGDDATATGRDGAVAVAIRRQIVSPPLS